MRGLSAWFRTEAAVAWLPLVMAIAMIGGVFAWQAYQSEERRAERAASRLAEAVAQDIGRSMEQLDLILRTVMGVNGRPRARASRRSSAIPFCSSAPRATAIAAFSTCWTRMAVSSPV